MTSYMERCGMAESDTVYQHYLFCSCGMLIVWGIAKVGYLLIIECRCSQSFS